MEVTCLRAAVSKIRSLIMDAPQYGCLLWSNDTLREGYAGDGGDAYLVRALTRAAIHGHSCFVEFSPFTIRS